MIDKDTKKVMIVDDCIDIRITVKVLFEARGFEVQEAETGIECLEALKQGFSGVIVMDIMMPEMDGWETVRQIATQGYDSEVMIFMLTALDSPDAKKQGLDEYVTQCLTKPFEPEDLVSTVEKHLGYLQVSKALAEA